MKSEESRPLLAEGAVNVEIMNNRKQNAESQRQQNSTSIIILLFMSWVQLFIDHNETGKQRL